MQRTFRVQALEDAFTRDGYVVLPLLRPEDVTELRAVFERLYPERRADFESTALNQPEDQQHLAAHAAIAPFYEARAAEYFADHRLIKGFFTCKRGNLPEENRSEVVLHQDLTSADEPEVRGVVAWSPLVDVDLDNGCLEVVPGSHRFVDAHRGMNMPWAFRDVEPQLRASLRPLPIRAGEAIVYDAGLIHCSAPNATPWDRPVVGLGVAHRAHRLIHVYSPDGQQTETYEVEPGFYQQHCHDEPPAEWIISKTSAPLVDEPLTPAALDALLAGTSLARS